ncbi:MAG: CAP domain-containing protein [Gemmatimonadales bacterium]|nr:CAP domain-containing protein [Gemmatimonadales bacterium]
MSATTPTWQWGIPAARWGAVGAVWLLAGLGCTAPRPAPPVPIQAAGPDEAVYVAGLVNHYRSSRTLRPVEYHPALAAVAQSHAEAMAAGRVPYSHAGLEERMALVGLRVRVQAMGENLAAIPRGTVSPLHRAVERWIASDAHRHTMEGCFDLTGVGMARSPRGVVYLSQIFVLRAPGQPTEARRGSDLEMARCR